MKNGKKDIILGIINNKLKHLILEKTPFTQKIKNNMIVEDNVMRDMISDVNMLLHIM